MSKSTTVAVTVAPDATMAEFVSALWADDDDNTATFLTDEVTETTEDTFTADDGTVHLTSTGLPDKRVALDDITFTALSVDRWINEDRRITRAVALPLLATLADAAEDKDDVSTLQYMAKGEPVSKRAARKALRSFTPEVPFGPVTEDWRPAYSVIGMDALAALIAWAKVNDK